MTLPVRSEKKFDASLEDKLHSLPARLELFSQYILRRATDKPLNESDSLFALLSSWKDLTVSIAKVCACCTFLTLRNLIPNSLSFTHTHTHSLALAHDIYFDCATRTVIGCATQ